MNKENGTLIYKIPEEKYLDLLNCKLQLKEYQQRVDRAIEYINNQCLESDGYVSYGDDLSPDELIKILKGE